MKLVVNVDINIKFSMTLKRLRDRKGHQLHQASDFLLLDSFIFISVPGVFLETCLGT